MNGISDLSAVFGRSTQAAGNDGDELTVTSQGKSSTTATSLLNSDKSVVSSAGGAMLAAMNTSDVRADKVASLKAAIASGTYNVSAQDVAQKLIGSMLGEV